MVEAKLHLSYKEADVFLVSAMIHLQPAFSKAPEVFDAVDVGLAFAEGFVMVDADMVKAMNTEPVVDVESVGIHPRLRLYMDLYRALERLPVYPPGEDDPDLAVSLQKPEYRDFAARASSTPALALAAEVRLVNLDFTRKLLQLALSVIGQLLPYASVVAKHRVPVYAEVLGHASRRDAQPEQPRDLFNRAAGNSRLTRTGRELLAASLALTASVRKLVRLPVAALRTTDPNIFPCQFLSTMKLTTRSFVNCMFFHN